MIHHGCSIASNAGRRFHYPAANSHSLLINHFFSPFSIATSELRPVTAVTDSVRRCVYSHVLHRWEDRGNRSSHVSNSLDTNCLSTL